MVKRIEKIAENRKEGQKVQKGVRGKREKGKIEGQGKFKRGGIVQKKVRSRLGLGREIKEFVGERRRKKRVKSYLGKEVR